MSDAPKNIWLQYDDDYPKHEQEITWCEDKQHSYDVKYIRADLATYNPETHILIAKDEVPMGLWEALKVVNSFINEREKLRGMGDCIYSIHNGCENEQNLNASHLKILCTALIAAKIKGE